MAPMAQARVMTMSAVPLFDFAHVTRSLLRPRCLSAFN
jgi:hypothetical protein